MTLRIEVRVKPKAKDSRLEQAPDGTWLALLRAEARDGKANAELIALVAKAFGTPRASVRLKSGASGRLKLLEIDAPSRG